MYLLDSNIIIYSYSQEYEYLRNIFINEATHVSEISRVEVLGYHKITAEEENYFNDVFNFIPCLLPTQEVINQAIITRRKHNLKLGDCLIAATALVHDLTIYTRNQCDFEKVSDINCISPLN